MLGSRSCEATDVCQHYCAPGEHSEWPSRQKSGELLQTLPLHWSPTRKLGIITQPIPWQLWWLAVKSSQFSSPTIQLNNKLSHSSFGGLNFCGVYRICRSGLLFFSGLSISESSQGGIVLVSNVFIQQKSEVFWSTGRVMIEPLLSSQCKESRVRLKIALLVWVVGLSP